MASNSNNGSTNDDDAVVNISNTNVSNRSSVEVISNIAPSVHSSSSSSEGEAQRRATSAPVTTATASSSSSPSSPFSNFLIPSQTINSSIRPTHTRRNNNHIMIASKEENKVKSNSPSLLNHKSHVADLNTESSSTIPPLCKYYLRGYCQNGTSCLYSHSDPNKNNKNNNSKVYECSICFENIMKTNKKFGLLTNCNHVFCLDCIMTWREKEDCLLHRSEGSSGGAMTNNNDIDDYSGARNVHDGSDHNNMNDASNNSSRRRNHGNGMNSSNYNDENENENDDSNQEDVEMHQDRVTSSTLARTEHAPTTRTTFTSISIPSISSTSLPRSTNTIPNTFHMRRTVEEIDSFFQSLGNQIFDPNNNIVINQEQRYKCPICRKPSKHIIPSLLYYKDDDDEVDDENNNSDHDGTRNKGPKSTFFETFKKEMRKKKCKFFTVGTLGSCPFGQDCYYAHYDQDGNDMKHLDYKKGTRTSNFTRNNNNVTVVGDGIVVEDLEDDMIRVFHEDNGDEIIHDPNYLDTLIRISGLVRRMIHNEDDNDNNNERASGGDDDEEDIDFHNERDGIGYHMLEQHMYHSIINRMNQRHRLDDDNHDDGSDDEDNDDYNSTLFSSFFRPRTLRRRLPQHQQRRQIRNNVGRTRSDRESDHNAEQEEQQEDSDSSLPPLLPRRNSISSSGNDIDNDNDGSDSEDDDVMPALIPRRFGDDSSSMAQDSLDNNSNSIHRNNDYSSSSSDDSMPALLPRRQIDSSSVSSSSSDDDYGSMPDLNDRRHYDSSSDEESYDDLPELLARSDHSSSDEKSDEDMALPVFARRGPEIIADSNGEESDASNPTYDSWDNVD